VPVAGLARRLARALPDYLHTGAWAVSRRVSRSGAPLAIVQGVILSEAGVLLAVRLTPRGWELPGGNLEVGEDDESALVREVREETGIEISVGPLVGEYRRSGFLPHTARVYRCRPVSGAIAGSPRRPGSAGGIRRRSPRPSSPGVASPCETRSIASTDRCGAISTRECRT
jgi:8-oxo-dGTP pyrophosphatase MutT (NUDIX family)